jgi:hypothetical protein
MVVVVLAAVALGVARWDYRLGVFVGAFLGTFTWEATDGA